MKVNSILLFGIITLLLVLPSGIIQAQNKANPPINYSNLLTQAPSMVKKKFYNKKFLIKKKQNEIYCKFGLDSKAREYYGNDLEIRVQNVLVQHGQLLIEYSPNFYLVVDDFADFEMYDSNGRKVDIQANRPRHNYQQPAARYQRKALASQPSTRPTAYQRPQPSYQQPVARYQRKPLTRKPSTPKSIAYQRPQPTPKQTSNRPFKLVDFHVPPQQNVIIKKAKSSRTPYNNKSANPKNNWLKKGKSTPQKSSLIDIKFPNLAEQVWNNPVTQGGNIVLFGCANGRCAAPFSGKKSELTSADIDGQRCIHTSADGSRCHRNTQWPDGRCAFH